MENLERLMIVLWSKGASWAFDLGFENARCRVWTSRGAQADTG
jgi:hypothetical protein